MDLGLSEEQEMLKTMSRDFLTAECPKALVKEMGEDEKGYTPEFWRKMAEMGWLGLPFPEKYGGMGMGYLDLMVLLEEMGRACLLGPFFSTVVLAGYTIMETGSEEQKKELLPKISRGDLIMTLALTEVSARYDAASIAIKAVPDKGEYVINGTKLFVPDANVANSMICVARTKDGAMPEDGVTLFLVDATSPGVTTTLLKTMAGDKQCEVTFDNVRVPEENIIGEMDKGWPVIEKVIQKATIGLCAYLVGGIQAVLEMCVDYTKERIQFDRPLATQEAIQFYLADMATDVTSSKDITYRAGWEISEDINNPIEVSITKAWVNDAAYRVTRMGVQVHGAIGFTWDHDMHLFYKRAMMAQAMFGGSDWHRALVAKEVGL